MKNKILSYFVSIITISFLYADHDLHEYNYQDDISVAGNHQQIDEEHLPTGTEVVADLYECQLSHLEPDMEIVVRHAIKNACATLCQFSIEPFSFVKDVHGNMVQGFTAAFVLSESHITIHTYPEVGYVAINVFTCGTHTKPEKALEVLVEYFKPTKKIIRTLLRGTAALE